MGCGSSRFCRSSAVRDPSARGSGGNTQKPAGSRKSKAAIFTSRYRLGESIGKGHFAKVYQCVCFEDGGTYAVKVIQKLNLVDSSVLHAEVEILRQVGHHKNVLGVREVFDDAREFYIVMEFCSGGDLFNRIVEEGKVSEKRTSQIMKQLAQSLQHIHANGVTHRDLKPENILLTTSAPDAAIKVGDFGLSKLLKDGEHTMRTVCGTWAYCAPEVIRRQPYTHVVDNWTLGVLMYILLAGYHPFDVYGELPEAQLLKRICLCEYDFDDDVWTNVSQDAKDIIRALLQVEPHKRMSLYEFQQTSWIRGEGVSDRDNPAVYEKIKKLDRARRKFIVNVFASLAVNRFKNNLLSRLELAQKRRDSFDAAQQSLSLSPGRRQHTPDLVSGDRSNKSVDDAPTERQVAQLSVHPPIKRKTSSKKHISRNHSMTYRASSNADLPVPFGMEQAATVVE